MVRTSTTSSEVSKNATSIEHYPNIETHFGDINTLPHDQTSTTMTKRRTRITTHDHHVQQPQNPLSRIVYLYCSLGFHTTNHEETSATRRCKSFACAVNLMLLMYSVLSLCVLENGVVQYTMYAFGVTASCVAQLVYVTKKTCSPILWMSCICSVLLGPMIAIDLRNAGGAFAFHRGIWYVPQCMVAEAIPSFGGTRSAALFVYVTNLLSFFIILIIEASQTAQPNTGICFGLPVVGVVIPMSIRCFYIICCRSTHRTTASIIMPPTKRNEVESLTNSGFDEDVMDSWSGERQTPTLSSGPLVKVYVDSTLVPTSSPAPTTPQSPSDPLNNSPRFFLDLNRSELQVSQFSAGGTKSFVKFAAKGAAFAGRFEAPSVFVVVDPGLFLSDVGTMEKYVSYVQRCAQGYHGSILCTNELQVSLQFHSLDEAAMVQSALGFCSNLLDMCHKHCEGSIFLSCAMSYGDMHGINVQSLYYMRSSAHKRCCEMIATLQEAQVAIGCDASLTEMFSKEALQKLDDVSKKLNYDVFCVHPSVARDPNFSSYQYVGSDTCPSSSNSHTSEPQQQQYASFRHKVHRDLVRPEVALHAVGRNSIFKHEDRKCSSNQFSPLLPPPRSDSISCDAIYRTFSRALPRLKSHRISSATAQSIPVNFPTEICETWLKFDTDRSGELSAEEVWKFFHRLGLKMTQERFFEFLEHVDTDGSCTISMQEFADAYDEYLGGVVLMSHIRRLGETLTAQGFDPGNIVLDTWHTMIGRQQPFADAEQSYELLVQLGIQTTRSNVKLMIEELDDDSSGKLHVNDLLAFFIPEMSLEEVAKQERMERVTRAIGDDCNPDIETIRTFQTHDQCEQHEAVSRAMQYDFYAAIVVIFYMLYSAIEASFACGMWHHRDLTSTVESRSVLACVLDVVYLLWVLAKFYMPHEINGRYVVDLAEVRHHYWLSWDMLIDVVGGAPIEWISTAFHEDQMHDPLFRLHKLTLLYYLNTLYVRVTSSWNASLSRILLTFLWWVLCIHMFACVFLSLCPSEDTSDIITINDFATNTSASAMYAQSFDWAIKLMVGLNRGNPIPRSDAYVGLSLCVVIIGVIVFSVIVTTISNALMVRDASTLFNEKLEEIKAFFEEVHISQELTGDVIQYYRHMFHTFGTTQPTQNLLHDLPPELDVRVRVAKTTIWFSKVSVFQPLLSRPMYTFELNRIVQPVVMLPEEYVSRQGSAILSVYVVSYGSLYRYLRNGTIEILRRGHAVNEYGILHNVKALHDVRVPHNEYANLFEITKMGFSNVMSMFPELQGKVRECVADLVRVMASRAVIEENFARDTEGFFKQYETKATSTSMHHGVCEKLMQM
eukprot:PhF_6_TR970/c0_g1_i1/m.1851